MKKEVITCLVKMDKVPAALQPVKARVAAGGAKVARAAVAATEKVNAGTQAAVKAAAAAASVANPPQNCCRMSAI